MKMDNQQMRCMICFEKNDTELYCQCNPHCETSYIHKDCIENWYFHTIITGQSKPICRFCKCSYDIYLSNTRFLLLSFQYKPIVCLMYLILNINLTISYINYVLSIVLLSEQYSSYSNIILLFGSSPFILCYCLEVLFYYQDKQKSPSMEIMKYISYYLQKQYISIPLCIINAILYSYILYFYNYQWVLSISFMSFYFCHNLITLNTNQ